MERRELSVFSSRNLSYKLQLTCRHLLVGSLELYYRNLLLRHVDPQYALCVCVVEFCKNDLHIENMGNTSSTPVSAEAQKVSLPNVEKKDQEEKPVDKKLKPCCACPETREPRDRW